MRIVTKVVAKMLTPEQIIKLKGLDRGGDVQKFHTNNVARRMMKYMPYRSGTLMKIMLLGTGYDKIKVDAPYAKYQYYGKVMVGKPPKTATDRPLNYTKTKNPLAGPYWDRALKAAEMPAMQADLQRYVNRKAGKR